MSVLRDTAFGDVEPDMILIRAMSDGWIFFLKRDVIHHRAVDTHADKRVLLKGSI